MIKGLNIYNSSADLFLVKPAAEKKLKNEIEKSKVFEAKDLTTLSRLKLSWHISIQIPDPVFIRNFKLPNLSDPLAQWFPTVCGDVPFFYSPFSRISFCDRTVNVVMCHSGLVQPCYSLKGGTAWGWYFKRSQAYLFFLSYLHRQSSVEKTPSKITSSKTMTSQIESSINHY